jgi:hypothetical protein
MKNKTLCTKSLALFMIENPCKKNVLNNHKKSDFFVIIQNIFYMRKQRMVILKAFLHEEHRNSNYLRLQYLHTSHGCVWK